MYIRQYELGCVFVECLEYLRRMEEHGHGPIDFPDINGVISATFLSIFTPMLALQVSPDQKAKL